MKILKSTSLILVALFTVASIFGIEYALPLLLFCFGLKEFISAGCAGCHSGEAVARAYGAALF